MQATYIAVPLAPPSAATEDAAAPPRRPHASNALPYLLAALLLLVCLSSDLFLYQQLWLSHWRLLRHLVDSSAHGAVGACAWGLFLCFSHDKSVPSSGLSIVSLRRFVLRCLASGALASALDIDHFIAAGALSLRGATHLRGRPFGHSVTFVMAVVGVIWGISRRAGATPSRCMRRASLVVIAWMSHQLRDAVRRGLWCWPLGSTPAIPYPLYLLLELALPFALARWIRVPQEDDQHKRHDHVLDIELGDPVAQRDRSVAS
ncbi:hypothetical protein PINS_up020959 [Pythium insidiosum]|nr:hypothetical protein PINS_up007623 [Pythium insidiosum]GLE09350.1 hypothetical protein PINS_up020959 [Pythium insidiosum]